MKRTNVLLFLGLTFGIAWAIEIGSSRWLPFTVRAALAMFVPALAAWLVRGPLGREGFADAGLSPNLPRAWPVYARAYAIVPLAIAAGFFLSVALRLQRWGIQSLAQILSSFGVGAPPSANLQRSLSPTAVIAWAFAALTIALPINMVFCFGEEFGWRGYLLVRLEPLGRTKAALLVGVIWGLWHAPLIAFDHYVYPGHPVAGVLTMLLYTTSFSVIFAWLRFSSNSVWPAVLAHAANNAQAQLGYAILTPADSLLRPPAGLVALIPFLATAAWIVATRRLDDRPA